MNENARMRDKGCVIRASYEEVYFVGKDKDVKGEDGADSRVKMYEWECKDEG